MRLLRNTIFSLVLAFVAGAGLTQDSQIVSASAKDAKAGLKIYIYRLAANKGNSEAQVNLGNAYRDGDGVTQDYTEALKWYRLAAEQGYAFDQYNEVLKLYRLAAEKGDTDAQYNLAWMYNNGEGVPEDDVEAVKWYRLAAEQGDADAQSNLGFMYDEGEGVAEDDAEAVKWYRLAAEQGKASAQYNLGVMYENGEGVLQNNVRSHMWYGIASTNGDKDAAEWRDERAGLMTSADISEAQKMARECMNSKYQNCGW